MSSVGFGRRLKTLVRKQSSRLIPASLSILVSSWPEAPMKGRCKRASSAPQASPTIAILLAGDERGVTCDIAPVISFIGLATKNARKLTCYHIQRFALDIAKFRVFRA